MSGRRSRATLWTYKVAVLIRADTPMSTPPAAVRARLTREALAAATRVPLAVLDAHVFPACAIDARLALGVPPRRWWTTPQERAAFEASPRCAAVARFVRLSPQRKIYPQQVRLPIWYGDGDVEMQRWPDDDAAARAFIYMYREDRGDRKQGYLCSVHVLLYAGPMYLETRPFDSDRASTRGRVKVMMPF